MLRRIALATLGLLGLVIVLAGVAFLGRHELMRRYEDLPPFSHAGGEIREARVAMRDGVDLATTIYEPEGAGPWPTVLIRNPYADMGAIVGSWCDRLVRYGYACVYQDVRGQGESEGEWEPAVNEAHDGSDTLRWLAQQPFMDGNIGMIGPSYLAAVQWAAASEGLPPEVKTFLPSVFTTNTYDSLYEDGMFRHETFTAWGALMAKPREMGGQQSGTQYQNAIRHRPHIEVDERFFGAHLPWYREWISSPSPSAPLWKRADNQLLLSTPERLDVPVLMIGGWYDVFFGPQFADWERLASQSRSRFVIGPWTHIGRGGNVLETPGAGGGLLQWEITLDWLGHHLRGEPLENGPGVHSYVMREQRWQEYETWPPLGSAKRFHLFDLADASRCGGGGLSESAPSSGESAEYVYDPDDPVPTRGGAGMLAFLLPGFDGAPAANVLQEDLCDRDDILSFETLPLEHSLHFAGRIEVALTVASDARDTAFTAKVVEVMADGGGREHPRRHHDSGVSQWRFCATRLRAGTQGRAPLGALADRVVPSSRVAAAPGHLVVRFPEVSRAPEPSRRMVRANRSQACTPAALRRGRIRRVDRASQHPTFDFRWARHRAGLSESSCAELE